MHMQHYIDQLVEEIHNLMKVPPPYEYYEEPADFEKMMMEFEEAFMQEDGIPAATYSKISREQLPPVEKLSQDQIKLLNLTFMNFLNYCQYFPEFPENLPDEMVYKTLRDNWEKFILPEIPVCCHQEFCEYDKQNCPFPGYCKNCDEIELDSLAMDSDMHLIPAKPVISFPKIKRNESRILNRKNHFKKLIREMDEGRNIAGIYNYCDRWCERCLLREKCSVYQLREGLENESSFTNDIIWSLDNFLALLEAVSEIHDGSVEKKDIDNDPAEKLGRLIDEILPDYTKELIEIADNYVLETMDWLEVAEYLFEDNDPSLKDLYEIIERHHYLIAEKLERANYGLHYLDEEDCRIQNDVYGSAKVALISARESLTAWLAVAEAFPCQEDIAFERCKELKELEEGIQMRFPDAEKFVRPGFDENNSQ